jgi:hypothetical protein
MHVDSVSYEKTQVGRSVAFSDDSVGGLVDPCIPRWSFGRISVCPAIGWAANSVSLKTGSHDA